MRGNRTEKPLVGLIADLFHGEIEVIRQEIELAKVELGLKAGRALKYLTLAAVGGGLLLAALIVLLQGAVATLSEFFPPARSAAIVPVFVGCVGLVIMGIGIYKVLKEDFTPGRATEVIEQGADLAGEETA